MTANLADLARPGRHVKALPRPWERRFSAEAHPGTRGHEPEHAVASPPPDLLKGWPACFVRVASAKGWFAGWVLDADSQITAIGLDDGTGDVGRDPLTANPADLARYGRCAGASRRLWEHGFSPETNPAIGGHEPAHPVASPPPDLPKPGWRASSESSPSERVVILGVKTFHPEDHPRIAVTEVDDGSSDVVLEIRLRSTPRGDGSAVAPVAAVLTITEAAAYLRTSRASIFKLLGTEIPRTHVGGSVRVLRADLDAYLERNREPLRGGRRSRPFSLEPR